jgi:hypothetical protein
MRDVNWDALASTGSGLTVLGAESDMSRWLAGVGGSHRDPPFPPTRNAAPTPDDGGNFMSAVTMSGPLTVSATATQPMSLAYMGKHCADEAPVERRAMPTARHLFLDLETTGLISGNDQITEAAWIADDGTSSQFFVAHTRTPHEWVLTKTDYLTRIAPAPKTSLRDVLEILTADVARLAGHGGDPVYLVGACPAFDDRFLRHAYRTAFQDPREPPYNYHVIDVEAVALGALGHAAPLSLRDLRAALGIAGANAAAHTALADAAEVKLIWDALRARHRGPA